MIARREFLKSASAAALALAASPRHLTAQELTAYSSQLAAQSLKPLPPSPNLPPLLVFDSGEPVKTPAQWHDRRREILARAAAQMYGTSPAPPRLRFEEQEKDGSAFGGKARRRQVRLLLKDGDNPPAANLLLYTPAHVRRAPVIVGLNFWGNETLSDDPGVLLPTSYVESDRNGFIDLSCVVDHRATAGCRGIDAKRWPVEEMIDRGYALCTLYRGDIDADVPNDSVPGLRAAYPELQQRPDSFGAVCAWAWTLSRMLDFLETDHRVDAKRAAVFGWSRLGKAAVWAGASDARFAAVLSQESGTGGAKLFRSGVGEDVQRLITHFPYWWAHNFRNYVGMDKELPFDQHEILASIAPRPLFVASAVDDHLSYPPGEFASAVLASQVYRFLGVEGIPSTTMPAVGSPMFGRISYQIRPGGHDVTHYDWVQYLHFLDLYMKA